MITEENIVHPLQEKYETAEELKEGIIIIYYYKVFYINIIEKFIQHNLFQFLKKLLMIMIIQKLVKESKVKLYFIFKIIFHF